MEIETREALHRSRLGNKWLLIAPISGGVIAAAFFLIAGWFAYGTVEGVHQRSSVAVDAPFEVKLNQPLLQIALDKIKVTPQAEGAWTLDRSLTEGDVLKFTPKKALVANTAYTVQFHDTRRVTGARVDLPKVTFETEAAPGIAEVSFDDEETLAADASMSVALSAKNRDLRDLELQTVPKLNLTMTVRDDMTFSWKSAKLLPQGKKLTVTLIDKKSGEVLLSKKVRIAAEPKLTSKPKEVNFGRNDKATLVFSHSIDQRSGKLIFSDDGEGMWQNDKTYVFTPKDIQPGKTYSYTVPKGLRSKEGGIVEKAQKRTFSTPGAVRVLSISPLGQELSQKHQTIRVNFDQPVDKKSAESRVTLSRGTITSRSWEGNTLVMTGENFGVQRTVHIAVRAGIKPVFGLPSNQGFGGSFTTEIPTKKLNVPMYYQQYAQSCESASLRMALAFKGRHIGNDMTILKKIGYSPRPMDKKKNIWDDPQQQFVGNVNGNQGNGTGWGVYAEPVARAARSYDRGADVQYGVTASFVASNIRKGNPVILWGIWNESATQRSWKTPSGRKVSGPVPMHVRLVVGVKGRVDNPVGFYIHDPITGPAYWTTDYMIHNARRAGAANMAVSIQ